MGKTFYTETADGGIAFHTERRVGDVRIPNYVYDMWLPLLGVAAIGVYAVYCRLERQGTVKSMNQAKLARACRMGTGRLSKINDQLQGCGFIRIKKPQGQERLMHWTTTITILDPPMTISAEIKEQYALDDYETLCPWLQADSPENPNGFSGGPNQGVPEGPDRLSNIATLDILQPLEIEKGSLQICEDTPTKTEPLEDPTDAYKTRLRAALGRVGSEENWADPADAGGADDWSGPVDAFAGLTGMDPRALPGSTRREWGRVLKNVGARWEAGPREVAEAIAKVPESEFDWRSFDNPHQAENVVGVLIGQIRSGGIKRPDRGKKQQSMAEAFRKARQNLAPYMEGGTVL